MFGRVVLASTISLFLISCSSNELKVSDQQISDYRGPAAVVDSMEHQFQSMVQTTTPLAKVNLFDHYLKISYRTEGEVSNFEAELDTAAQRRKMDPSYSFVPQGSNSYSNLMQLRYLKESEHELITHVYKRALETATDVTQPQDTRKRATEIVGSMHESLSTLNNADKLQTLDLVDSLREIARQYHGASLVKSHSRMPASVDKSWEKVEKVFAPYEVSDISKYRIKYQKQISQKVERAMTSHEIVLEPIQEPVPQSDRAPSSDKYAPGVGTYGNVLGLSFPNGHFCLTYDDGPNGTSTIELLDYLSATKTPATFFWLTKQVLAYPKTIEKTKSLNYAINNHSWTHPVLTKLDDAGLHHEIDEAVAVAKEKIGVQPVTGTKNFRFFRCPYGACFAPPSVKVRQRIANLNLIHVYWTVDSLDWNYTKDPQRVLGLIKKGIAASGRGIILMHDIHEGTVHVTKMLLPWIAMQNKVGNKITLSTVAQEVDNFNKGVTQ